MVKVGTDERKTRASRAAYQNENASIRIDISRYHDIEPGMRIRISSLPALLNGDDLARTNLNYLGDIFKKLEIHLQMESGIRFDINRCYLTRIDINKDIQLDYDFSSYRPVFSLMKLPRRRERMYRDTWYCGGKEVELKLYDKRKEKASREDVSNMPATARLELSVNRKRRIESELGSHWLADIIRGPQVLQAAMQRHVGAMFRPEAIDTSGLAYDDDLVALATGFYRLHGGRSYLNHLLRGVALHVLRGKVGLEEIRRVVEQVTGDKEKAARDINKLRKEMIVFAQLLRDPETEKFYARHYDELRTKALTF